jgi:hypothetical protein
MGIYDPLSLIFTAISVGVSLFAYLNSQKVREREDKFEEELERKQKNWQIETMHFPKLIKYFRARERLCMEPVL